MSVFLHAMSQSEREQVETSWLNVQSGAQTPKKGNLIRVSAICLQWWHFLEWKKLLHIESKPWFFQYSNRMKKIGGAGY